MTEAATPAVIGRTNVQSAPAKGAGTLVFTDPNLGPYNYLAPAAFTPDGNAYFNEENATAGEVVRFHPDGTFTNFVVPFNHNYNLVYAHGSLWTGSYDGIVRFSSDGAQRREYYLGAPVQYSIADGPNGSIYATSDRINSATKLPENMLYQVGGAGGIKKFALPVRAVGPIAMGQDSNPWFVYENDATKEFGIARLASNGTTTLFPVTGDGVGLQGSYSLVLNRGSLYFVLLTNGPGPTNVFGKIDVNGVITKIPYPANTYTFSCSADKGGNLWMFLSQPPGTSYNQGLFMYDTFNGKFIGPYFTTPVNTSAYPGPFVGPDDNVYFKLENESNLMESIGVFTRQLQTLEPGSVVLKPNSTGSLAILETHANGPWTARSLNPLVAVVSSTSSKTGDFNLIGRAPGSTSIAVTDRLGNTVYGTVTTQ